MSFRYGRFALYASFSKYIIFHCQNNVQNNIAVQNRKIFSLLLLSGQTEYGRTAVKWATDYFLKAHTGHYEFYGQVSVGTWNYGLCQGGVAVS